MKLRTIGLIGILTLGLLAGPLPAEAQQPGKNPRIGYLSFHTSPGGSDKAFRQALRDQRSVSANFPCGYPVAWGPTETFDERSRGRGTGFGYPGSW